MLARPNFAPAAGNTSGDLLSALNFKVSVFALACVWPGLRKDRNLFEEIP